MDGSQTSVLLSDKLIRYVIVTTVESIVGLTQRQPVSKLKHI